VLSIQGGRSQSPITPHIGRLAYYHSGVAWKTVRNGGFVFVLLVGTTGGQPSNRKLSRFDEYAVPTVFKGKPAAPKLIRARDKLFRTRILEGAAAGPNFAGGFTIAEWGCGSACVSVAVANAATGDVYAGPFGRLSETAARLRQIKRIVVDENPH